MLDELTPSLRQYQAERQQQLDQILALLRQDERVCGAWVFGSLGRGDADALSDIDLIVVVRDDHLQPVIAERYTFAEQVDGPLFCLESPQNAPKGGAYLMVCYNAPTAPHLVDFYWQSDSLAWDSSRSRQVYEYERAGLASDAIPESGFTRLEAAAQTLPHNVRFFWMMLLIAAKYVCRDPHASEIYLLNYLSGAYEATRSELGQGAPLDSELLSAPAGEPAQKMLVLRYLARSMASLMAFLPTQSWTGILAAADRFLAMVEETVSG